MRSTGSSHGFRRGPLESRVKIPEFFVASQRSPLAPPGKFRGISCTCENAVQVQMESHKAARGKICGNQVFPLEFCQWGDPWELVNSRGPLVPHGNPRDLVGDPTCEVLKYHHFWGLGALLVVWGFHATSRMFHMPKSIC